MLSTALHNIEKISNKKFTLLDNPDARGPGDSLSTLASISDTNLLKFERNEKKKKKEREEKKSKMRRKKELSLKNCTVMGMLLSGISL